MAKFDVKGLDKLQKKLKDDFTLDDVKEVVQKNGGQLQNKMQREADFKGHFGWVAGKGRVFKKPTGTTKRSIGVEIKDGGFAAEVAPETEYSPYLEYGTRFMKAQPFVKPAYEEQKAKFMRDMQRLVK